MNDYEKLRMQIGMKLDEAMKLAKVAAAEPGVTETWQDILHEVGSKMEDKHSAEPAHEDPVPQ